MVVSVLNLKDERLHPLLISILTLLPLPTL